jgi:hypothetical protein
MTFKRWVTQQLKRIKVRLYRWERGQTLFKTEKNEQGYESISRSIVRTLINHPDSKFTIAPLSRKRYIVNKKLDMFIIIDDYRVEITNHIYHYVTALGQRDLEKLRIHFDRKVDLERVQYEDEIKSQINNSLNTIYEKISKKENETEKKD